MEKQRCRCLKMAHPKQRRSQVQVPRAASIGNYGLVLISRHFSRFDYRVGLRQSVVPESSINGGHQGSKRTRWEERKTPRKHQKLTFST